jgi:hypothetical protein
MQDAIQTLRIEKEILIHAPIDLAFEAEMYMHDVTFNVRRQGPSQDRMDQLQRR